MANFGKFSMIFLVFMAYLSPLAAKIFRDAEQEAFVKQIANFSIAYPRLALYDYPNFKTIPWGDSEELPDKFYVKLNIDGRRETLELKRNRRLVNSNFNAEEYENHKVIDNNDGKVKKGCYYVGTVLRQRKSLAALSTCHGLKGFVKTIRGNFLIEPMRNLSKYFFPHLVYQPNIDNSNDERRQEKSETSSCAVENDPDPVKYKVKESKPSKVSGKRENETGRKRKRNAIEIPSADVEVFVVADKDTVAVHGNASVEGYILTMMNMVAEMYRHASLGVNVNIVVAKILLLSEDQDGLTISHHGDKTLRSFCEWQYSRVWYSGQQNNRILKYDAAILLTRKDLCSNRDAPCGTIGMAYIGGVCKPRRRCSVIEDIGLNTAFTIAHELGHRLVHLYALDVTISSNRGLKDLTELPTKQEFGPIQSVSLLIDKLDVVVNLGMQHDREGNRCRRQTNGISHMMSPTWPQASHGDLMWSKCSQEELKDFLSSYKSACIKEESSRYYRQKYKMFNAVLPGTIYSADEQCKQQYGPFASHCKVFKTTGKATDMCKTLWCFIESDNECVTKLDPAAKGTPCGPGKWCMYGKCINNNTIPERIDGQWSQWSNWTACSRTCGIGVTKRRRLCDDPLPSNGGKQCAGESKEYKTCNVKKCPVTVQSFRAAQCAQYNNQTVTWIPVLSERRPCGLYCRQDTNGIHFSVRFATTVIDGTECRKGGAGGICVDGKCEQVGCDNQLHSNVTNDACGICGGNGTTCNVIEGEFTQMSGEGYVTAVVIPPGARNVVVQEEKPCASFLALKGDRGTYHINGNWKIELPGEFDIDGTIVYYQRKGTQETFFAKGPTKEPLHIMVLFQDFNFGIKYSYTLPLKSNKTDVTTKVIRQPQRGSYGWMQGPWGPCSVYCGGGITRRRPSRCVHIDGSKVSLVSNSYCSGAKKPPVEMKTCNEKKCGTVWGVGAWSSCSKTCGLGRKYRTSQCVRQQPETGEWKKVSSKHCSKDKPVTLQICVEKSCFLNWKTGPWSKCNAPCGEKGSMNREVSCPLKNACHISRKPKPSRPCVTPQCSYAWISSKWSQCSKSCGIGFQTRKVDCRETYSLNESAGMCQASLKPHSKRKCPDQPCNKTSTALPTTVTKPQTTTGIPGAPEAGT
eukprot:gene6001-11369_t